MDTSPVSSRWAGGVSPWGMGWRKLMMWWFIVTDGLLFAGFLAGYGFARLAADGWPVRSAVFNMNLITLMTFILLTSSATMATAVAAARRRDRRTVTRQLLLTMIGGLCFLGMQAIEWAELIHAGATLTQNPWGAPAFSAYFFMTTGFHGTHVLIGVVVLLITLLRARKDLATPEGIEIAGLYWHFVDLVWVFIFGCFYLL